MITQMPLPPLDIILGPAPRWYVNGENATRASVMVVPPPGESLGVPVLIPKDIFQDSVLKYQLKSNSVKLVNNIPIEDIKATEHTPESLQQVIDSIKHALMKDIIQNGIPYEWAQEIKTITYNFRKKTFIFDTEDLTVFELLMNHMNTEERINPTASPLVLNLSRNRAVIPAKVDGNLQLFTAQHLAGTELSMEYMKKKDKYVSILNELFEFIDKFEYDKTKISILWTVIYGHDNWYGTVERIKL